MCNSSARFGWSCGPKLLGTNSVNHLQYLWVPELTELTRFNLPPKKRDNFKLKFLLAFHTYKISLFEGEDVVEEDGHEH